MPRLFHFSDDPSIEVFHPRPPLRHPEATPLIWAIDSWHSPLYFLPRDCPRVAFWPLPTSTQEDIDRWMIDAAIRMVICVGSVWVDRIQQSTLYRYEFNDVGFVDCNDHGVHTCNVEAKPLSVEPMTNLFELIFEANVELRICQSLVQIGKAIQDSTLHFSMIRMSNASGWEGPPGIPTTPGPN